MNQPRAMTTRVTAELLGCSTDRVCRLIRDGKLKAVRFGRRGVYRVLAESIDALLGKPATVKHLSLRATTPAELALVAAARATLALRRRERAARA